MLRQLLFMRDRSLAVGTVFVVVIAVFGASCRWPIVTDGSSSELRMSVGVTHTDVSVDPWHTEQARRRPETLVRALADYQNQHLMGWGTLNPEPGPDSYDWDSLDRRVANMERIGSTPVLTLCCAPDWMKGGQSDRTDWTRLEVAPDSDHYDDFAELAATAARRYPNIKHFAVWNELKGFYSSEEQRWDVESYTILYNQVYRAIKDVRPDALVGGPYVVIDAYGPSDYVDHPSGVAGPWGELDQRSLDVIEYWLANYDGADFIAVDGYLSGGGSNAAPTVALERFRVATEWIAARTSLPIWWMEFYVDHPELTTPEQHADTVIELLDLLDDAGADAAFLWDPNGTHQPQCGACLWSDLAGPTPGEYRPLAAGLLRWQLDR